MKAKKITNFNEFLKQKLNEKQYQAATHPNGNILVIAGAGSGKTRVITSRIAHLISHYDIAPHSIIALTFTNKAAKEMSDRIATSLENTNNLPFIGTFHSYCLRLLKQNSHLLNFPFFSIFDEDDRHKLLSDIIKRANLNKKITPRNLAYIISQIKNNISFSGDSIFENQDPIIKEIFHTYESEKKACNAFDFDDLLLEAVKLFETKPEFKERFQNRVNHILVDEYQDTNVVQHHLLKQMAINKDGKNVLDSLCVVGDEDQSIYSWRGATVKNIQSFETDFSSTKIIKLEQNYRSAKQILDAANHVIRNNKNRYEKKLWSEKKGTDRIKILKCSSEYQEGELIATYLKVSKKKYLLSSNAILYRNHYQSRAIEEALIKNSIPYRIIGGIQFYERKEIKDILAYLRLLVNPFDRVSLFRIINCPPRRLGKKFEENMYETWSREAFFDFKTLIKSLSESATTKSLYKASLDSFVNIFESIDLEMDISYITKKIVEKTEYINYLFDHYEKAEAQERTDNLNELLKAIKYFEQQGITSLADFLEQVTLLQKQSLHKDDSKDKVQLMTLHAAKGLEFDTVMVVGLEEGILPSTRSMESPEAIEEERRLFYVGITRAKERLLISNAKYRTTYGQMSDQIHSRFLDEIPSQLANEEPCMFKQLPEIESILSNWIGIKTQFKPAPVLTFSKPTQKSSWKNTKLQSNSEWQINQPVKHQTFGIGIIKKIEQKTTDRTYLTIKFKLETKKLDSKFVNKT